MRGDEDYKRRVEAETDRRNKFVAKQGEEAMAKEEAERKATETSSSSDGRPGSSGLDQTEAEAPLAPPEENREPIPPDLGELPMPAAKRESEEDIEEDRPAVKRRWAAAEAPGIKNEPETEERVEARWQVIPAKGGKKRRGNEREQTNEKEDEPKRTKTRIETLISHVCGTDDVEQETYDEHIKLDDGPWLSSEGAWEAIGDPKLTVVFDPKKLREAKREELDRFKRMKVYEVVDRGILTKVNNPTVIGVRWVVTQKPTGLKARLVAHDVATTGGIDRDSLFAGTPGLNIVKSLISRVVSGQSRGYRLLVADIKTAFLYGSAKRELYIELPA